MRLAGLVLAGGRSTRMGRDKALLTWQGQPLALHVAARLMPQVETVIRSGGAIPERLAALGLPVVPDAVADQGPLGGILAGLRWARAQGCDAVLTAPCDAPNVPTDLAARLLAGLGEASAALPVGLHGPEPLFALWRVGTLQRLEDAAAAGALGVRAALAGLQAAEVTFPQDSDAADPFANLNAPDDLARAAGAAPTDA